MIVSWNHSLGDRSWQLVKNETVRTWYTINSVYWDKVAIVCCDRSWRRRHSSTFYPKQTYRTRSEWLCFEPVNKHANRSDNSAVRHSPLLTAWLSSANAACLRLTHNADFGQRTSRVKSGENVTRNCSRNVSNELVISAARLHAIVMRFECVRLTNTR